MLCREDCSAWQGAGGAGGTPSCWLLSKPCLTPRQEEGIRQLADNFYTSLFPQVSSSSWLGPGYFPFLLPVTLRTMENHPPFSASLLKKERVSLDTLNRLDSASTISTQALIILCFPPAGCKPAKAHSQGETRHWLCPRRGGGQVNSAVRATSQAVHPRDPPEGTVVLHSLGPRFPS